MPVANVIFEAESLRSGFRTAAANDRGALQLYIKTATKLKEKVTVLTDVGSIKVDVLNTDFKKEATSAYYAIFTNISDG